MTYNPNHDRTDWRTHTDRELTEAARESGHELAIVLGERLEDMRDLPDLLAEAEHQLDEATRLVDYLRAELRETEAQLAALQAILDAEQD